MNSRIAPAVLLLTAALTAPALLTGCSGSRANGEAEKRKPPVPVEVRKLAPIDRVEAIDVVGSLSPRFEAAVKPEFSGTVTEVYVSQWVPVRKGQALARLDTREGDVLLQKARAGVEAAKASLLQTEVRDRQAERELARMQQLKANGLATQQALEDAQTGREASTAMVAAAKSQVALAEEEVRHAQTRLAKSVITAPMDGVVAERNASPGDVVGEPGGGAPVFRVVDNRVLDLTVTVPAGQLARLAVGQPLEFTTDAFPGRTFEGKVSFINPAVDPASRSVKVIAEVPNAGGELRGGLFVRGRVVLGTREDVLAAPREALMQWDVQNGSGVLFVVENDVARRRTIQTAGASGNDVEIASGVKPGDLVVARGAFNLKDGDKVLVTRTVAAE